MKLSFQISLCLFLYFNLYAKETRSMINIDAGYFFMGCNDISAHNLSYEHLVYLEGYSIDPVEVTNFEYEKIFPEHKVKRHPTSSCDDCPVTKVSWFEARDYCQKLGKDLPTEAQWEKAADEFGKCGYSWSENLFKDKLEAKNSGLVRGGFELDEGVSPVGSYPSNRYGIYDMSGNVWEWTRDWMSVQIPVVELINPLGPEKGHFKVRRGGAWSDDIRGLMSSWRDWSDPRTSFFVDIGFRCAKNLTP